MTQNRTFYSISESISIIVEFISKVYKIPSKNWYNHANLITNDGYQ